MLYNLYSIKNMLINTTILPLQFIQKSKTKWSFDFMFHYLISLLFEQEPAIGVVQVDGTKPSDDFLELVEKEKRGEITGEDIRRILNKKYAVISDDGTVLGKQGTL